MKKTILLVIGNNTTRSSYENNLKKDGLDVITTTKTKEGLKIAKTKKPDLMVVGVFPEEGNGFDFVNKLKSDPETKLIPILLYSPAGNNSHRNKAMELGVSGFINGLQETPRDVVTKVRANLGEQKSYKISISSESSKEAKLIAEDIGEKFACSKCGSSKQLDLFRLLRVGKKTFKIAFVCPDCG